MYAVARPELKTCEFLIIRAKFWTEAREVERGKMHFLFNRSLKKEGKKTNEEEENNKEEDDGKEEEFGKKKEN